MITVHSEFIGTQVKILESTNNSIIGLTGKIIDETKSTFLLSTEKGTKVIAKDHNIWKLANEQIINGSQILKRPEDRIKIKI